MTTNDDNSKSSFLRKNLTTSLQLIILSLLKYCVVRPDSSFYYQYINFYTLVFPIVGPDTCYPVTGLRVVYADSGRAELTWQSEGCTSVWELAWGPVGTPPDSCAIVLCDTVGAVLDSLLPDTRYVAYVRSKNEYADPTCYSEWSSPSGNIIPLALQD